MWFKPSLPVATLNPKSYTLSSVERQHNLARRFGERTKSIRTAHDAVTWWEGWRRGGGYGQEVQGSGVGLYTAADSLCFFWSLLDKP